MNGIIDDSTRADEFRTRIPDKMILKNNEDDNSVDAHQIFITDGNTDSVNGKSIPRIVGKNIIDAINNAEGGIRIVNHTVRADNATNVDLTAVKNSDGSTTVLAGDGNGAKVENCINAKNADVANWANNAKIIKVLSPTNEGDFLYIGDTKNQVQISHSTYAKYASSDTSKGTIEERLTNLGFKTAGTANRTNLFSTYVESTNGFVQGTVFALTIKTILTEKTFSGSKKLADIIAYDVDSGRQWLVKPNKNLVFKTGYFTGGSGITVASVTRSTYTYKTDGSLYLECTGVGGVVDKAELHNQNDLALDFVLYLRNSDSETQFVLSDYNPN